MHKLDITKAVDRFLAKRQPKQFRQIIHSILKLRHDPAPHDSKPLINSDTYRRVDVGEFRIIYRLEDDTVKIALVGKRNDQEIYRKFKNNPCHP